jgi:hypothetical protein
MAKTAAYYDYNYLDSFCALVKFWLKSGVIKTDQNSTNS